MRCKSMSIWQICQFDYLQRRIQKNNKQYLLLPSQHLLSEFKFSRSHLEEPQGTIRPLCWLALLLSLFVCIFSDVKICAIYWRQRTATYLVSNSFSFQLSSSLCSQIKKGASFTDSCKSFIRSSYVLKLRNDHEIF